MIQDIWLQTKWTVIEFYLWLRSKAFGENDHLKSFKEPDALSRRYGFNCIIGIKDFQFWDTVPVFSPHQAACLISGYSPFSNFKNKPAAIIAMSPPAVSITEWKIKFTQRNSGANIKNSMLPNIGRPTPRKYALNIDCRVVLWSVISLDRF